MERERTEGREYRARELSKHVEGECRRVGDMERKKGNGTSS